MAIRMEHTNINRIIDKDWTRLIPDLLEEDRQDEDGKESAAN